jgi:hypothetical protein
MPERIKTFRCAANPGTVAVQLRTPEKKDRREFQSEAKSRANLTALDAGCTSKLQVFPVTPVTCSPSTQYSKWLLCACCFDVRQKNLPAAAPITAQKRTAQAENRRF